MVLWLRLLHLVLVAERLLLRECDSLDCLLLLRFLLTKLLESLLLLGIFLLWRVLLDHI